MRDKIKDAKYFDTFINEDLERIAKFSEKLEKGEVREDRIFPVKSKMHDLKLGILIAQYSRGDDLFVLRKEFIELIAEWKDVWESDFYNKNLKMISLAVLFEVDNSYINVIREMLQESGKEDWLLEYLLSSFEGGEGIQCEKILFPKSFSTLKAVVQKESKVELLEKYLTTEWYSEDCGCYEAHKSKQNVYSGYWSFESGAIAKILQIDDSILKDVPYYPYDLVHYGKQ